ncbi:uncharacterized protein [Diadema antillarum]|uniref:uncharacterized protein n=1 Tax=Diadema antillarum TaxID=105358 RepID=UPI003A8AFD92
MRGRRRRKAADTKASGDTVKHKRPLTSAEKQRNYRERLKRTPGKYEEYKRKNAERQRALTQKRKLTNEKRVRQRAQWREKMQRYRQKKRNEDTFGSAESESSCDCHESDIVELQSNDLPDSGNTSADGASSCSQTVVYIARPDQEEDIARGNTDEYILDAQFPALDVLRDASHFRSMNGNAVNDCGNENAMCDSEELNTLMYQVPGLDCSEVQDGLLQGPSWKSSDTDLSSPSVTRWGVKGDGRKALTAAERQRRYREKLRQSPEKWEEYRRRDLERRRNIQKQKARSNEQCNQSKARGRVATRRRRNRKQNENRAETHTEHAVRNEGCSETIIHLIERESKENAQLEAAGTKHEGLVFAGGEAAEDGEAGCSTDPRNPLTMAGRQQRQRVKIKEVPKKSEDFEIKQEKYCRITEIQKHLSEAELALKRLKGRERMRKYRLRLKQQAQASNPASVSRGRGRRRAVETPVQSVDNNEAGTCGEVEELFDRIKRRRMQGRERQRKYRMRRKERLLCEEPGNAYVDGVEETSIYYERLSSIFGGDVLQSDGQVNSSLQLPVERLQPAEEIGSLSTNMAYSLNDVPLLSAHVDEENHLIAEREQLSVNSSTEGKNAILAATSHGNLMGNTLLYNPNILVMYAANPLLPPTVIKQEPSTSLTESDYPLQSPENGHGVTAASRKRMTASEKQRNYRERLKQDPEKWASYKQKEMNRYLARKSALTPEQVEKHRVQSVQRTRNWRARQKDKAVRETGSNSSGVDQWEGLEDTQDDAGELLATEDTDTSSDCQPERKRVKKSVERLRNPSERYSEFLKKEALRKQVSRSRRTPEQVEKTRERDRERQRRYRARKRGEVEEPSDSSSNAPYTICSSQDFEGVKVFPRQAKTSEHLQEDMQAAASMAGDFQLQDSSAVLGTNNHSSSERQERNQDGYRQPHRQSVSEEYAEFLKKEAARKQESRRNRTPEQAARIREKDRERQRRYRARKKGTLSELDNKNNSTSGATSISVLDMVENSMYPLCPTSSQQLSQGMVEDSDSRIQDAHKKSGCAYHAGDEGESSFESGNAIYYEKTDVNFSPCQNQTLFVPLLHEDNSVVTKQSAQLLSSQIIPERMKGGKGHRRIDLGSGQTVLGRTLANDGVSEAFLGSDYPREGVVVPSGGNIPVLVKAENTKCTLSNDEIPQVIPCDPPEMDVEWKEMDFCSVSPLKEEDSLPPDFVEFEEADSLQSVSGSARRKAFFPTRHSAMVTSSTASLTASALTDGSVS